MEYTIHLGTVLKIKRGMFLGAFKIMYCGMSNENTFVLAPFMSNGNQGFSSNIYYPAQSMTIHILDKSFDVIEVTPDYLVLGE